MYMYFDRFFDEREFIFFYYAVCFLYGIGWDFCGVINLVGLIDVRGWNQCFKSGFVRGIFLEDV